MSGLPSFNRGIDLNVVNMVVSEGYPLIASTNSNKGTTLRNKHVYNIEVNLGIFH
jgi:hypothetical protein